MIDEDVKLHFPLFLAKPLGGDFSEQHAHHPVHFNGSIPALFHEHGKNLFVPTKATL